MSVSERIVSILRPPTGWSKVVADLARPYAIYAIAFSTAWAIIAQSSEGLVVAAGSILTLLYGARGLENERVARHGAKAEVETSRVDGAVKVAEATGQAVPMEPGA